MAFRPNNRCAALGSFIHQHARWQLWATLTYSGRQESHKSVERDVRKWLSGIARASCGHVRAAIGVEPHCSGSLHVHALLAKGEEIGELPTSGAARSLWSHGNAAIDTFDANRGAAWYLAKGGRWGILIGCPRRARCRRSHGCSEKFREVEVALP